MAPPDLEKRPIQHVWRVAVEAVVPDVADHTHDRQPVPAAVQRDPPLDRVAVGPVPLSQRSADDRDPAPRLVIEVGERSAREQPDADRLEVAGAGHPHLELRTQVRVLVAAILDLERLLRGRPSLERHVARRGRPQHAQAALDPVQHAGEQLPPALGSSVLRPVGEHLGREDVLGCEPRVHLLQLVVAGQQQPGADQQRERHGHLGDRQEVAEPVCAAGVGGLRAAFFQCGRDVGARRQRRHDAERQPGGDRHPERESEHPAVECDLARPGCQQTGERHQQVKTRPGEHQTQRAPDEAEQHGFGEQLREYPPATGAERGPERQLALSPHHPGQREIGDVGAGDQQHQPGGAQQDQQHRTGVAGQLLTQRCGEGGVAGVGLIDVGEVLLKPAGHRRQIGAELLDGDPVPQPTEGGHAAKGGAVLVHPRFAASPNRTGRCRHVDIVVTRVLRNRGQYTDHGVRPVVHLEHRTHDVRVATESLLPVRIAQHQHRLGAQVVVGVDERAADQRLHAEHVKEVRRHHAGQHLVRLAAVEQRERHAVILDETVQGL